MELSNDTLRRTIVDFLNAHRKAVFAVLDKEGLPTTSLMLYAIDDTLAVYFGTRRAFSKYNDLKLHPVVSLSVIEEAIDPLTVVDVRGTVAEVDSASLHDVHAFFKSKNSSKYYVEGAPDFTMFKLTPHFVRYLDARSGELTMQDLAL
jgi:general stress protein 26